MISLGHAQASENYLWSRHVWAFHRLVFFALHGCGRHEFGVMEFRPPPPWSRKCDSLALPRRTR